MTSRRLSLALSILSIWLIVQPAKAAGVWGTRPLLGYFALTASLQAPLQARGRLDEL